MDTSYTVPVVSTVDSHAKSRRRSISSSLRSNRSLKENKSKSQLHLMSATGFTQEHKMSTARRIFKFISLPHFSEYFMSVDHHQIWRRHLAWSLRDGDHLRNAVTSRFASNMVFMSLLLGTEIGVLFSPSKPADRFRAALKNESYGDPNFWAAIILCVSIGLTLSTLVANFTAWAIIGAVSPQNSHAILRSSVGLDAAQLPARLVILSIYCFLVWVMMFIFILLPNIWGFVIAIFPVALIAYIVILYSSFGRLVIYSRAMQHREIFKGEEDNHMSSRRLFEELLTKAEKEKEKQSPLPLYYRTKRELSQQISELRSQEEDNYVDMGFGSSHATHYVNRILGSSVTPREEDDEEAEEEKEELSNNVTNGLNSDGHPVPQNPSVPSFEEEDSLGPLEESGRSGTRSVLAYTKKRTGSGRLRGESTRSMFENSASGPATVALTL